MTDPVAEAERALEVKLRSLMSACRRLGEHQSDDATHSAWAIFREAKALARRYAAQRALAEVNETERLLSDHSIDPDEACARLAARREALQKEAADVTDR